MQNLRYRRSLDVLDDVEDATGDSIRIVDFIRDEAGDLLGVRLTTDGFSSLLGLAQVNLASVRASREENDFELDYYVLAMEVFGDLMDRAMKNVGV